MFGFSSNHCAGGHTDSVGRRSVRQLHISTRALISSSNHLLLSRILAAAQVCLGAVSSDIGCILVGITMCTEVCVPEPDHNDSETQN